MKILILIMALNMTPNKPLEFTEENQVKTPYDVHNSSTEPNFNTQYMICHNGKNIMIFDAEWHVHYLHKDTKGYCVR